jgi:hypothetical protein
MSVNDYLMNHRDIQAELVRRDETYPVAPRIKCADGFSISVQATHGAYCRPRTNLGPWYEVECGYPSDTPTLIMMYAEDPERPTGTVYGYVPIELVEELIAEHGGMMETSDANNR